MSDDPDEGALDPNEDARIRALLAELGSGPDGRSMPPEVAARLDDTLARLVAERASSGVGAGAAVDEHPVDRSVEDAGAADNVVPLRRGWLPRATAAAAAVIVVGVGGVAAANLGVFGNGTSMSSDSGGSADGQVAESAPDATTPGQTDDDAGREATGTVALPRISSAAFASDVTSLLQRRTTGSVPGASPGAGSDAGGSASADSTDKSRDLVTPEAAKQAPRDARVSRTCPGPEITDDAVPNPIRYDGQLAVLVIHPREDGRQLVEAWSCSGDRRLASTSITP